MQNENSKFGNYIESIQKNSSQSYIIVVDNNSLAERFIKDLQLKLEILPNDYLLIKKNFRESIKISEVKKIKTKLALRPQGKRNLVAVINCENLTGEAANSLLKIIEEPPQNSLILIFTQNAEQIIPTITSRCLKLVIRNESNKTFHQEDIQIFNQILVSEKIYQKFQFIEKILISQKDIKKLLTSWLLYLRGNPIKPNKLYYRIIYKELQRYFPNINKKLFLENLTLNLDNS